MREKILTYIERNSRVDLKDLAIMLGTDEATIANEIAQMEKEGVICGYHTLIDWDKTSSEKVTSELPKITPVSRKPPTRTLMVDSMPVGIAP